MDSWCVHLEYSLTGRQDDASISVRLKFPDAFVDTRRSES